MRALAAAVILAAAASTVPAPGPHEPPTIDREWVRFRTLCVQVGMCERQRGFFESIPPPTTTTTPPPPPPVVVAAPAPASYTSGVEQWRSLVAAYFPASEVDFALCVLAGESGGSPTAYNPSTAAGLMQVHWATWGDHYGVSVEDLFDPSTNMRIAADIWANYGWSHWSAAGGC